MSAIFTTSFPATMKKKWTRLDRWNILWCLPFLALWGWLCLHVHARLRKILLFKSQNAPPLATQDASSPWKRLTYGIKAQMTNDSDTLSSLPLTGIKFLRRVIRKFLYYGYAVNSIILVYLISLSVAQSQFTQASMYSLVWFLDYVAMQPNVMVQFYVSGMILTNHSGASYISEPKSISLSGDHFYMGNKTINQTLLQNWYILYPCKILWNMMASAAEA